jgi:hypothetical protein
MYTTILLAAALQDWERYSTHALAARDVAATLAKGVAQQLHVLSVYDYPPVETTDLPQSSPCGIGRISCGGWISSWSTNSRPTWRPSARRGWPSA